VLARTFFLCHPAGMTQTEKDYSKEFASKGGRARAQSMTPEERRRSALKAVRARWKKAKAAKKGGSSARG
jgi:hypothetical protein